MRKYNREKSIAYYEKKYAKLTLKVANSDLKERNKLNRIIQNIQKRNIAGVN